MDNVGKRFAASARKRDRRSDDHQHQRNSLNTQSKLRSHAQLPLASQRTVLVTIFGKVVPGTQLIPSGGATYAVIDQYGQIQPGGITLGTGGTYTFGVSLIAARNGTDLKGRKYTIKVNGKDALANRGHAQP